MKQSCANKLAMLYCLMADLEDKFDQDDCTLCAIGHAIKAGKVEAHKHFYGDFCDACDWFELPKNRMLGAYLFGTTSTISFVAKELSLPANVGTARDVCIRIEALLDRYGYDLEDF